MNDKELLDIYTDYLISSFGLTTGTGLSRLLDGAISHYVTGTFNELFGLIVVLTQVWCLRSITILLSNIFRPRR